MVRHKPLRKLSQEYAARLQSYLLLQQETTLQLAYELGRDALAQGIGVLDMARIHQHGLAACLDHSFSPEQVTHTLQAAETFFMESLSPFEAFRRGFDDANRRLRQLNRDLECRNTELAMLNLALRELSKKILHVEEEERKRISRELHDEAGQALTAIQIDLDLMLRNDAAGAQTLREGIVRVRGLVQQTMDMIHRFARELRPAILDELGLVPALRSYLKAFGKRCGLEVHITGNGEIESLSGDEKTVLFRVAQESLTNVSKHAHATRVDITLRKFNNAVQMQIKDNGKSFRMGRRPAGKRGKRLGIFGMQERIRLVNGHFGIESAPGKGTTVSVEIPLQAGEPASSQDHGPLPQGSSTDDEHQCLAG